MAVVSALAQSQTVRYSRTSDLSWASATSESLAVLGPVSHNWTFGMSHIDLAIGPTDATESAIGISERDASIALCSHPCPERGAGCRCPARAKYRRSRCCLWPSEPHACGLICCFACGRRGSVAVPVVMAL